MRKQMEGDNQRRRALARQAREQGRRPSQTGASLSASKQVTSLDQHERSGPPPAGRHKPDSTRGGPAPPAVGVAERPRPLPDPPSGRGVPRGYRDLVDDVSRRAGVDFAEAKVAAEATVLALAWALDEAERERLLAAVPVKLHDVVPVDGVERRQDLPGFLAEVGRRSRSPRNRRATRRRRPWPRSRTRTPNWSGRCAYPRGCGTCSDRPTTAAVWWAPAPPPRR